MRPKSVKSILASLKMLALYAHSEDIDDFDHGTVKAFLYWGKEERLWAARTFRNHRMYLKIFFDWCVKQGTLKQSPVDGIEQPKLPRLRKQSLSHGDLQKVLSCVRWYSWRYEFQAIRNETIFYFLALTGLRLKELRELENTDIDLASREIHVRSGKGQKYRVVPIHPQLVSVLRAYYAARKHIGNHSRYAFTGARSEHQLGEKGVQEMCKTVSAASGVKVTPHMLRHTFGRRCIEEGWDIFKIQEIMGHADIATTRGYLSISVEHLKKSFGEMALI